MRTNIEIDDALIRQAMASSGAVTKREAVQRGLELLVSLGRQAELRSLRGKLDWSGDLDDMRTDEP